MEIFVLFELKRKVFVQNIRSVKVVGGDCLGKSDIVFDFIGYVLKTMRTRVSTQRPVLKIMKFFKCSSCTTRRVLLGDFLSQNIFEVFFRDFFSSASLKAFLKNFLQSPFPSPTLSEKKLLNTHQFRALNERVVDAGAVLAAAGTFPRFFGEAFFAGGACKTFFFSGSGFGQSTSLASFKSIERVLRTRISVVVSTFDFVDSFLAPLRAFCGDFFVA